MAVVTDARFSGVSTGACIGHVAPEALAGGPIGRLRDGDLVEIVDRPRARSRRASTSSGADGVEHGRRVGRRGAGARGRRARTSPPAPAAARRHAAVGRAAGRSSGGTWGGCVYDVDAIVAAIAGRGPRGEERDGMILYRTTEGPFVEHEGRFTGLDDEWDGIFNRRGLAAFLKKAASADSSPSARLPRGASILPPIESQEVWAAGVTYYRSRTRACPSRREAAGAASTTASTRAQRPELFFKATPHRVVGHRGVVHLRARLAWMRPRARARPWRSTTRGRIIGYTVGNDMSCRDIEGENPLYLPQAKTFDGCAARPRHPRHPASRCPRETRIAMQIRRAGAPWSFAGRPSWRGCGSRSRGWSTYLFRDNAFPLGCFLMTGTGVVPPEDSACGGATWCASRFRPSARSSLAWAESKSPWHLHGCQIIAGRLVAARSGDLHRPQPRDGRGHDPARARGDRRRGGRRARGGGLPRSRSTDRSAADT